MSNSRPLAGPESLSETVYPFRGLPDLDPDKLRAASVLVAGGGNIGSPLTDFLARSGIGHIRIVDRDRVERKNLINQAFRPDEVGSYKAEALAERLKRQFPRQKFEARAADLEDLSLGDFQVDVILGALDSRRARQALISGIGWPLGIAVVDGGVGELVGRVQVFMPGPETACLECSWGDADYRLLAAETPCEPDVPPSGQPTVAPAYVGTVVAGIMCAECIRILADSASFESHEIAFDLYHFRFLVSRLSRAKKCRFDHEIVREFITLGKEFATATVGDLLTAIECRFGSVPTHLETRRGLLEDGFGHQRFVTPDQLLPKVREPLTALGLAASDRIRVRTSSQSAFLVLDGPKENTLSWNQLT